MAKGGRKRARKAMPTADNSVDGHNDVGEVSCSLCEVIIDGGKEIQCRTCHCHFHHVCANISDNVFEVLHPILSSVNWICQECIDIISVRRKTISTEIQTLTDAVHKLEKGHAELKQKLMSIPTMVGDSHRGQSVGAANIVGATSAGLSPNISNIPSISQVVSQTVKDQLRRKKNIIVSGLPESSDESDVNALCSLCEEYLGCKPWVDETKCKRIGKTVGNRPRHLLVTLSSDQAAAELLAAAKRNLAKADPSSPVSKIYFNPDLSPEDAKQAYLKRQERRSKAAQRQQQLLQQQQQQSVSGSSGSSVPLNPLAQSFPVADC